MKAQCFDPLEHILFGRRLQGHILGHKSILAENDPEDMLARFEFLKLNRIGANLDRLTSTPATVTTKSLSGLKFWGFKSSSVCNFSLLK